MLKLKNQKQITTHLFKQSILIEKALIFYLEAFVAELENHAKESAGYQDQTGNLKSSIGGVVLKDGKPITYEGFKGKTEGVSTGKEFINSLVSKYQKGYTILLVAGMEYASPLENYLDFNVLIKTELKMQRELPEIMQKLKKQIDLVR